jgi:tartrate-resistant acid phosphatase type 5
MYRWIFLLVFLLAACTSSPTAVTADLPVAMAITDTPFQPLPTDTPTPSPTATLTPTPTPTLLPSPTATATPLPLIRFAVIGDYGIAGTPEADVAALVLAWQPDFIVTTGDNNYPNGEAATIDANIGSYYHSYIAPYLGEYGPGADINRFFPVLGNHDWITDGAQPYFDYFTLPGNERYYDFTWGPLHFFMLNSDEHEPDKVGRSSTQAAWLKEQMGASTLPWQIVVMHHAPYTSGAYNGSTDWMRWPFAEWGADAVLAGHEHVYERLMIDDIPYFVNGVGGGAIYWFERSIPYSIVRFSDDYGAMFVTASQEKILFEFITRTGEKIDEYTLWPRSP